MNLLALLLAATTVFSFADPRIDESSGLVDLGALMVTTNDSGDDAVLYVLDGRGRTVGTTRYAGRVRDVEALAPDGPGYVWAADIGDNGAVRDSVRIYRVPVGRGARTVRAPSYELVYPDGAHDAESLVVAGGRAYVVTKALLGGPVYASAAPLREDRPNRLHRVGTVDLFATDAALLGSDRVIVRGYGTAAVLTFPGFEPVSSFALPAQEQGEGISVGPAGRIRLSSEGAHAPVLQIRLPAVREEPEEPRTAPAPATTRSDRSRRWMLPAAAGVLGVAGWMLVRRRRR
ncbi:MAG: hypothetical protein J7518_09140 [Nocardioidaceae bacterium]|nr:hypothetical protein [Nocardioidaceae bacterium]